ncbi:MAG TPA: glycosyltransferase family 39 protein, partial [Thermoanaerobaculia bacterium]|nr:glycosyltransferase family 39 protein [Thermoanaerobaculia bacterium]
MHRAKSDLLLVFALTLLTNLLYFASSSGDFFYPDSATYLVPARFLLHGAGFVNAPGVVETLRTPGYPIVLLPFLLLQHTAAAIVIAQHVMNAFLATAIYLVVRRRLDRATALTAAILFAIDTPTIHYANKVLTETLFTAMLFALFLLALRIVRAPRMRDVAFAGLLAGALVLVRPVAILYFAALAVAFAIERVGWKRIAAFVAIALALPLAWAARNAHHTGVFHVASIAGSNMLAYRAAGAVAIEDGGDFLTELPAVQQELLADADAEIEETMHIPDAGELSDAVRGREYNRIGRRIFLEHPRGAAMLTLRGILVLLFESDWEAMMIVSRVDESTVHLALGAWTVALTLFALIGLAAIRRRDRPLALLLGLTIAYFVLISAGGEAEARFRVPIVPMLAIAAAAGMDAVVRG